MECFEDFSGLDDLGMCLDDCNDVLIDCLERCGPEPPPVRTIIAYQYIFVADHAPIPNDPLDDQINQELFESEVIESSVIDIPPFNPPSPWPEVVNEENTCYAIIIAIRYDDNTTCLFFDTKCLFIG
ncbi:MAG: hypothetical protein MK226_21655 [Saprospiraceae bacterium]|nr:hypothetical protein [Saprospiraceae bacterium]